MGKDFDFKKYYNIISLAGPIHFSYRLKIPLLDEMLK